MNDFIQPLAGDTNTGVLVNSLFLKSLGAFALAFIVTLICAPTVIRKLISLKVGQPIRTAEEVHKLAELHGAKAGTPTMGGVLIVGTTLLGTLCFAPLNNPFIIVASLTMLGLSVLGFLDDYIKVTKKSSDGISAKQKLAGQFLIAFAAVAILWFWPDAGNSRLGVGEFVSHVFIPFYGTLTLDWYFYIPFAVLVIVGSSNAVNLTDGLDGLASGCSITTAIAYAVIAYICCDMQLAHSLHLPSHPDVGALSIFLMALAGACLGFLWFNCYPAKVFMGDTGSLALGGAFGVVAISTAQELVFVIVAGIFVMEALSVVLQVGSYKLRNKKRIFKMAPIHHHFELSGWKETQVITRFWMISLILAFVGLALIKTV